MERRIILNRLIQKYENSSHLLHPGQSGRRVMLRVDKEELPEYNVESATTRDVYNAAAKGLERDGLIHLQWAPDRPLITRFFLNLDNVDQAYEELGRPHPAKQAEQFINLLYDNTRSIQTDWIKDWVHDQCQNASETYRIPSAYQKNTGLIDDLLCAFCRYDDLHGQSISIRAFSIQCYHDSKRFEHDVQGEFLRIARQYNNELAELCVDEDIKEREQLAFLGLLARPELFEFSGVLALETETGIVDLAPLFPYGFALPSTQIDRIKRFYLEKILTLTFIENKTNYNTYIQCELKDDEMAIYLGGFLSPAQKRMCQTIVASTSDKTVIRLWADIDLGGFRMFEQLQQVFPALIPFRMSVEDVIKYKDNGLLRSASYIEKLQQAAHENRFPLFADVIYALLDNGVTIEQEVFYS